MAFGRLQTGILCKDPRLGGFDEMAIAAPMWVQASEPAVRRLVVTRRKRFHFSQVASGKKLQEGGSLARLPARFQGRSEGRPHVSAASIDYGT